MPDKKPKKLGKQPSKRSRNEAAYRRSTRNALRKAEERDQAPATSVLGPVKKKVKRLFRKLFYHHAPHPS